ncbi:transposase [Deinococcus navajonensis]|uniref:Transposase n=1 Tax=Deinococcus navajonensis TaxID=309884 RepID=A0ABV8XK37_9DEIO
MPAGAFMRHLQAFEPLFRDRRLFEGFSTTVQGILASGGLRLSQIARCAPGSTCTAHAERRLRRLVHNQNARADLRPARLTQVLTDLGARRMAGSDEVMVILDESDLRKPHSDHLEYLGQVRSLQRTPVRGFHTLSAMGIASNGTRALLYQTSFSALAPEFRSKNSEYRAAVLAVKHALAQQGVTRLIWVLDRGFDTIDFLRFLHQQGQLFVVRAAHLDRMVQPDVGQRPIPLSEALDHASRLTTLNVENAVFDMTTRRQRTVKVHVHGCAVHVPGSSGLVGTAVRLEAKDLNTAGWVLLSNLRLPADDVAARAGLATRLVRAYQQRWAIEDVFAWTKGTLGWESARVLHYDGLRVLVSCAWIVAAFLFQLGTTLDDRQLQLMAHLGGWRPQEKHPPGKRVLTWGLNRLAVFWMMQEQRSDPQRRDEIDALLVDIFAP